MSFSNRKSFTGEAYPIGWHDVDRLREGGPRQVHLERDRRAGGNRHHGNARKQGRSGCKVTCFILTTNTFLETKQCRLFDCTHGWAMQ